jgi:hypothetical protein
MSRARRPAPLRHVLVASTGFLPWDLGGYLVACLARRGLRVDTYHYRYNGARPVVSDGLMAAVRATQPQAVIGLKLKRIDPRVLAEVRAQGVFVALWYMDCFTGRLPPWVVALARESDVFATTARGFVDDARARGVREVEWLPEGVDLPAFPEQALSPAARATYGAEIAFVGNVFQPPVASDALALRRWRLLDRLGRRFQVKVWGPQAEPARARALGFPRVEMVRWPTYNEELVKVCQSSAIVLGINTVNTVFQYFSNRIFLTLACGGFHVTHYVPGMEELFENHRHLVWFQSDEECVELCAHYLKRPAARRRIADAGKHTVRRRWSMTRQVSRLLKRMEDVRAC